jgi:hypothetical protein
MHEELSHSVVDCAVENLRSENIWMIWPSLNLPLTPWPGIGLIFNLSSACRTVDAITILAPWGFGFCLKKQNKTETASVEQKLSQSGKWMCYARSADLIRGRLYILSHIRHLMQCHRWKSTIIASWRLVGYSTRWCRCQCITNWLAHRFWYRGR